MKVSRRSNYVLFAGASALALSTGAPAAMAQDDDGARTLSTVVVTTQKTEESIQDVPIAVSAFDPDALERLNIDTGSDLQFNIPNFGSTQGNFSAGGISIRGIINAAVGASSDAAVGTHVNGVSSSGSTLLETEFYDVERIEILRGPQGTLYGRNATGGVVNAITAKPILEEFGASAELTYGEFNNLKFSGHVNIPLGERLAARVAGFRLTRDGYSDAILPDGSTEDVDGRDLWAIRGTIGGDITDKLSFWLMAEHYEEDSTRTRATKQLCTKDTRPFPFNQGCVPYQIEGLGYARDANGNPIQVRPGLGTVNTGGTLGGVLAASLGLYDAFGTDSNAGATTSSNLREFETNLVPTFEGESNTVQAEFQYEFDNDLTFTFLASHNDNFRLFTDDYNKGIGTVPFNVTALTPDVDGDGDGDWPGPGAFGLTIPVDTRLRAPADTLLATDNSSSDFETTSLEARLQSDFDGAFNFTVGALKLDSIGETNYFVFFNTAEALGVATGLPGDRTYFLSRSPYKLDALGAFGEAYWDATDNLTWTLGLRYTNDQKRQENTPSLLLAPGAVFPGEQNGFAQGGPAQEAEFEEVTGRFGFDYQAGAFGPTDDTLLYANIARGYKGGGINPPQSEGLEAVSNTFDPEFINAFEVGSKSTLFGGAGILNLAAFYYDYEGYQISSIVNRTSVNENVDAKVLGFEGEFYYQVTENFRIDSTIGLLNSELADQDPLLDTYDQTGGDPSLVVVKDAGTTQNCVAPIADVNTLLTAGGGAFAGLAAFLCTPNAPQATLGGATLNQFLTLNGLPNFDGNVGNPVDVSGNKLPLAPEVTFSIGAEYVFDVNEDWDLSVRGDFYHRGEVFTRIFNLEADRIDSFQNANAAIQLTNDAADLELELFVKNLLEEDQLTNQYLTDASSGLFTNVFLLEPRQFGFRIKKRW
ncbi:MAG: TonB-dependent receptor [Hyphomonadaceae bacterium]|nr:TonB-dependent receptor [Hyphomonadaceae bacterium]